MPARGSRGGDQLAGCSVDDAAAAMDAAAALHAPLWGDRKLLTLPWVNRDFMVALYIDKLPPFVPIVATRFAALLEPGVIEVAQRFGACIGRYFQLHAAPWTITHQDFRLDNMLFDVRGGRLPVAVLDWQTVLPGPGVLDVSYFLGAGLLPPVRQEHEHALVERYHRNLVARGVKDYAWDRCWHDYRLHAAHGLIMAIVGAAITAPHRARRPDAQHNDQPPRAADDRARYLVADRSALTAGAAAGRRSQNLSQATTALPLRTKPVRVCTALSQCST